MALTLRLGDKLLPLGGISNAKVLNSLRLSVIKVNFHLAKSTHLKIESSVVNGRDRQKKRKVWNKFPSQKRPEIWVKAAKSFPFLSSFPESWENDKSFRRHDPESEHCLLHPFITASFVWVGNLWKFLRFFLNFFYHCENFFLSKHFHWSLRHKKKARQSVMRAKNRWCEITELSKMSFNWKFAGGKSHLVSFIPTLWLLMKALSTGGERVHMLHRIFITAKMFPNRMLQSHYNEDDLDEELSLCRVKSRRWLEAFLTTPKISYKSR